MWTGWSRYHLSLSCQHEGKSGGLRGLRGLTQVDLYSHNNNNIQHCRQTLTRATVITSLVDFGIFKNIKEHLFRFNLSVERCLFYFARDKYTVYSKLYTPQCISVSVSFLLSWLSLLFSYFQKHYFAQENLWNQWQYLIFKIDIMKIIFCLAVCVYCTWCPCPAEILPCH